MAKRWLVCTSAIDPEHIAWLAPEAGPELVYGRWDELAEVADGPICLILPGQQIHLTQAAVAVKQQRQIQQAVPYLLEDNLAGDVETLHFAYGRWQEGQVAVAVVEPELLRLQLQRASEVGLTVAECYSAANLVPDSTEEAYAVALADDLWLWRYGAQQICCSRALLGQIIALVLADEDAPQQVNLISPRGDELESEGLPVTFQPQPHETPWLWLMQQPTAQSINLLQGAFAQRKQTNNAWRAWRWPLALAASALVLQLATTVIETVHLQRQADQLTSQSVDLYKQLFPQSRRFNDPRKQMEGFLREQKTSGPAVDFFTLLGLSGQALQQFNSLQLQSLRFQSQGLELQLAAPNFQVLEQYKSALLQQSLQVELRNANSQGGQVSGQISIRGKS